MKELYLVTVFGKSASYFEEYYSEEEVKVIEGFLDDMKKRGVARCDVPHIEISKFR